MGEAQAEVAVGNRRLAAAATSNVAIRSVVAKAAATVHAVRTCRRSSRVGLCGGRIITLPIRAQFPNVAAHVIDAQFIWGFGLDGVRGGGRIGKIPSYIVKPIAAAIQSSLSLIAASGGIFPLRFCGQAEGLVSQFVELSDKGLAVVPRNHFHGTLHIARKVRRVAAHNGRP